MDKHLTALRMVSLVLKEMCGAVVWCFFVCSQAGWDRCHPPKHGLRQGYEMNSTKQRICWYLGKRLLFWPASWGITKAAGRRQGRGCPWFFGSGFYLAYLKCGYITNFDMTRSDSFFPNPQKAGISNVSKQFQTCSDRSILNFGLMLAFLIGNDWPMSWFGSTNTSFSVGSRGAAARTSLRQGRQSWLMDVNGESCHEPWKSMNDG